MTYSIYFNTNYTKIILQIRTISIDKREIRESCGIPQCGMCPVQRNIYPQVIIKIKYF